MYQVKCFPCYLTGSSKWDKGVLIKNPSPAGFRLLIVDDRGMAVGEAFNEFHGVEFENEFEAMKCYDLAKPATGAELGRWTEGARHMVKDVFSLEQRYWPRGFSDEEWRNG